MSENESEQGRMVEFPGNPHANPAADGQPAGAEPGREQPIPDQDERQDGDQGRGAGEEMSLEEQRKAVRAAHDRLVDAEDKVLLAEMKAGEVRILRREGAARHCVRKVLDAVTGEAGIDRFVEYGENPFNVVYFMPDQVMIEAACVAGGVVMRYNGSMTFIKGAHVEPSGHGFVKIVK